MPAYSQTARDITALRKIGDIDGAIAKFKSASQTERSLPEVRSAAAWVVYERDIKPVTLTAQRGDESLHVTEEMVNQGVEAVAKVKTWCNHDLYSSYSAYPTAFLMVAKILKSKEMHSQLKAFLEDIDATQLSRTKSGSFPSSQMQWVTLALDVVKHIYGHENISKQQVLQTERLLLQMKQIDKGGGLSSDMPSITTQGRTRRLPSHKQRFVLQYTRFLLELERFDELAKECKKVLDSGLFYRDTNLKWILYRRAIALKDSDPIEALKSCDDFVVLEERSYALLLRAEILLSCGKKPEALREAVHSLQVILEKDLRYITKNLRFVASLTEDADVKKAHLQMLRYLRFEQGQKPNEELEKQAQELGLPPSSEAPSFEGLRSMWNQINPEGEKRKTIGRAAATSPNTSKRTLRVNDYPDQSRFGEVLLAKIPTKDGTERFRPVVVIGEKDKQVLVGSLQTSTKHLRAVIINNWAEAGLKSASVFVPFWHEIPNAGQKKIGQLSDQDRDRINNVIKSR